MNKYDITAIWSPRVGMYFLMVDGQPVLNDGGSLMHLDRKSDCERYVKRHYHQELRRWKAEAPPSCPACSDEDDCSHVEICNAVEGLHPR